MEFQAIVAPTITELFEKQIIEQVMSGELLPGDRMPTEAEMAEKMNVSKSAVHAGVKELERMGFLEVSPRHGVYVANYAECGNVDTLMAILKYHGGKLDKHTTVSILEVGCIFYGFALKKFIDVYTEDDVKKLKLIIQKIREGAKNKMRAGEIAEYACSFHKYICCQSGNNVIPLIVNAFHDVNILLWTLWVQQVGAEGVAINLDAFIKCINEKDKEIAGTLFEEYVKVFLEKSE